MVFFYNYLCNQCLSPLMLWVRIMARCTWYNIMWSSLSVTCDKSVVFSWYSGFLHQLNWPPRYNWNISESCIKHHKPLYCKNMCSRYFCWLLNISRHWCIEINIISCDRSTILKALIMCKQLSIEILQVNDFYIG